MYRWYQCVRKRLQLPSWGLVCRINQRRLLTKLNSGVKKSACFSRRSSLQLPKHGVRSVHRHHDVERAERERERERVQWSNAFATAMPKWIRSVHSHQLTTVPRPHPHFNNWIQAGKGGGAVASCKPLIVARFLSSGDDFLPSTGVMDLFLVVAVIKSLATWKGRQPSHDRSRMGLPNLCFQQPSSFPNAFAFLSTATKNCALLSSAVVQKERGCG
jgi:hypothetical protein